MKSIRKAEFVLKGVTSLLMHAYDVDAADTLSEWRKSNKSSSKAGDDRSPPWTWQTYVYKDEEGFITMPSENLMKCLGKAGAQITLKKQKTFKELTQSGLLIPTDCLFFSNGGQRINMTEFVEHRDEKFNLQVERARKHGFDLLSKPVTVGVARHIRVRPMFKSWEVSGTINISAEEFDLDKLTELFEKAGYLGLGDWRPGCKNPGNHGMFEASIKIK